MEENNYSWIFNDKKERSSLWYTVILSIVIWLSIWWFLSKQYWMSLTVLLLTWLTYYIENNSEDELEVQVSTMWIKIQPVWVTDGVWVTFYDYNNINWYAYVYDGKNLVYLRLFISKKWIKRFDLKIDNSIQLELNSILPNFIEEQEKQELSLSEKLILLLKL